LSRGSEREIAHAIDLVLPVIKPNESRQRTLQPAPWEVPNGLLNAASKGWIGRRKVNDRGQVLVDAALSKRDVREGSDRSTKLAGKGIGRSTRFPGSFIYELARDSVLI